MSKFTPAVIIAALASLEKDNVAHWTGSGDPLMSVIENLMNSKDVTRADLKAVAPDFTRENMVLPEVEGEDDNPPSSGDGAAPNATPDKDDASTDAAAQGTQSEGIVAQKEAALSAVKEARLKLDEARKEFDAANAVMDKIITEAEVVDSKVSQSTMIKKYQESQAALAKGDAERIKTLNQLLKK